MWHGLAGQHSSRPRATKGHNDRMLQSLLGVQYAMFRKLVVILRDPIWNSLNCFLTFLLAFGLVGGIVAIVYAVLRHLGQFIQFLIEPIQIARVLLIFGSLLLLWYLATIIRSLFLRRLTHEPDAAQSPIRQGKYYKFWGVLWMPISRYFAEMEIEGPYCPTHFLEMEIKCEDYIYSFVCHGGGGNPRHVLAGPSVQELIPPQRTGYLVEPTLDAKTYLVNDIRQQVLADMRKSER